MQKHNLFFVLYLFSFYQLCPAIEFAVAKQLNEDKALLESNTTQLLETKNWSRQPREKRFLSEFVIAVATKVITEVAGPVIRIIIGELLKGHRMKRMENHVSRISSLLNHNYNNAVALKEKVTLWNPEVGNAIMVSREGFKCDTDFCAGKQTGLYTLGLCSEYVCYCDNGTPESWECEGDLMFDPVGKKCNDPLNMAICGY